MQGKMKSQVQNPQVQMFWRQQNQEMEQLNGAVMLYRLRHLCISRAFPFH
jgi:hypothetical protein